MITARFSFLAAPVILGGLLFSQLPAQGLRLDELFSTGTVTTELPASSVTLEQLRSRTPESEITRLTALMEAGEADRVLADSEVVLAWLEPQTPPYGEVLWLRARALEVNKDMERVSRIANSYIQEYSSGPRLAWFLVRVARFFDQAKDLPNARNAWAAIPTIKQPLPITDLLEGATIAIRSGDPTLCRDILGMATAEVRLQRKDEVGVHLLNAALLDGKQEWLGLELPPSQATGALIAQALMAESAGQLDQAKELYRQVAARSDLSAPWTSLVERRGNARREHWPPRAPATSPSPTE